MKQYILYAIFKVFDSVFRSRGTPCMYTIYEPCSSRCSLLLLLLTVHSQHLDLFVIPLALKFSFRIRFLFDIQYNNGCIFRLAISFLLYITSKWFSRPYKLNERWNPNSKNYIKCWYSHYPNHIHLALIDVFPRHV